MKKKIGTYLIGSEYVDLYVRDGYGGDLSLCDKDAKRGMMAIGIDDKDWGETVGTLLHESMEFVYMRLGCRYSPAPEYSRDHAHYLFSFDHNKFSDACMMAGDFIRACLPDLSRAHSKRHKSKRPS